MLVEHSFAPYTCGHSGHHPECCVIVSVEQANREKRRINLLPEVHSMSTEVISFQKSSTRKGFAELRKEVRVLLMVDKTPREVGKNSLLLTHPFRLVVYVPTAMSASPLRNGNLGQTDILHNS